MTTFLFPTLLLAHVLLTTAGYVGLIAASVSLLGLGGDRDARTIGLALTAWRRSSRIFGPLLGVGLIFGFGLASMLHVPLGTHWLIESYVLIALALLTQAGVMIPWQISSNRDVATGTAPSLVPVRFVLATLCVAYTAVLALMLLRPS